MRRTLSTRSRRSAAALVGVVLIAGLPALPAAADPSPSSPPTTPAGLVPVPFVPKTDTAKSEAAKAAGRPAPVRSPQATARAQQQAALMPTALDLSRQAQASGSDIAGVKLDVATGTIHLYRTDTRQPTRLSAGSAATGTVVVHRAKFSRTAITKALDTLTKDADQLVDRRVLVESTGPNADGSGITVSVLVGAATAAADVARATTELQSRYGSIVAKVNGVQQPQSDKALYFDGWRFNDYAPWYGGDRIVSNYGSCTSGFPALIGSSPVMLTAAHCGPSGTTFLNGPGTVGGYTEVGTSNYNNGDTDIAAIPVDYVTTMINVGPAENSGVLAVHSWMTPVIGQTICQSGSYTGEVCNLEVVDTGQRFCNRRNWLGRCVGWYGPFADAINLAGWDVPAAGHGDSGGPVYDMTSDIVTSGVGQVHGQLMANAAAAYPDYVTDTLWCSAPEGWMPRCSSGFSFAHMPGY